MPSLHDIQEANKRKKHDEWLRNKKAQHEVNRATNTYEGDKRRAKLNRNSKSAKKELIKAKRDAGER